MEQQKSEEYMLQLTIEGGTLRHGGYVWVCRVLHRGVVECVIRSCTAHNTRNMALKNGTTMLRRLGLLLTAKPKSDADVPD